jgi:hypothetical protein
VQQNQSQAPTTVDYLLESLKQQRNEATDALAIVSARFQEAAQKNASLIAVLNDRDALLGRVAELEAAEAAEAAEAPEDDAPPAPKPARAKKAA